MFVPIAMEGDQCQNWAIKVCYMYTFAWRGIHFYSEGYALLFRGVSTFTWRGLGFRQLAMFIVDPYILLSLLCKHSLSIHNSSYW